LFTKREQAAEGASSEIIMEEATKGYEALREVCSLHSDVRLDHTLVFQLDEYWAPETPDKAGEPSRKEIKRPPTPTSREERRETLRSQAAYLTARTSLGGRQQTSVDPFGVFRHAGTAARRDLFDYEGYVSGACRQVARVESLSTSKPTAAFDLSLLSAQSVSCLIMEVWFSEIFITKELSDPKKAKEWGRSSVGKRCWGDEPTETLLELLKDYRTELYMAWLLLVEVLPMENLSDPEDRFELRLRGADPSAVACRHWYKTACQVAEAFTPETDVVVRRLPGRFSVRGDWFLAVANGSRSGVLADRALDLLSSRRANFARLQMGVGLPTRRLVRDTNHFRQLRTGLWRFTADGQRNTVKYREVLDVGANNANFFWLWRSSLKDYHYQARVWEKSIVRTLRMWNSVRNTKSAEWMDCFDLYDKLAQCRQSRQTSKDVRRTFELLTSWKGFNSLATFLEGQLALAAPVQAGEAASRRQKRTGWSARLM
jgi:hypothetical protein